MEKRITPLYYQKKSQSWTIVKAIKTDFIQDLQYHKRPQYRTGLNYIYNIGKWEFVAKEQNRKFLRGNIRDKGNYD
jgi:hypothetical protein